MGISVRHCLLLLGVFICGACGTYYDPADSYVRGVRFYDRGDYVAAKEIWDRLAEVGDCDAEYRLGLLRIEGRAVVADLDVARGWWERAANKGQPRAQLAVGDLSNSDNSYTRFYCTPDSCRKDAAAAYKWYLLADKTAKYETDKQYVSKVLPRIRATLTLDERQEGERLAAEWRATPQLCDSRRLL